MVFVRAAIVLPLCIEINGPDKQNPFSSTPQNLGEGVLLFSTAAVAEAMASSGAVPAPGTSPRAFFCFLSRKRAGCRRRVIAFNYATAAGPLFYSLGSSAQLGQEELLHQFHWERRERRVIPKFETARGLLRKCLVAQAGTRPPFSTSLTSGLEN